MKRWTVTVLARTLSPFPFPPSTGVLIGVVLGLIALSSACQPGLGKTAYIGASVFDGTGSPPILDAVIIVAGGRIEAIGPPDIVSVPRGATEVPVHGRWVIPGLIDAHAHAERWMLNRFLAYGVTSIRDLGGDKDSVVALRDATSLMSIPGPRMYISGTAIDAVQRPWPTAVAKSDIQIRQAIDQLVLLDVAQAKISTGITRNLLGPLMDEAKVLKLPVAAHLGKIDAVTAARAGVRSLEHMSGVVEATVSNPSRLYVAHNNFVRGWNRVERSWSTLDSASLDRTARELVQAGAAIVPTLILHETYSRLSDQRYTVDLSGVPGSVRDAWDVPAFIRSTGLTAGDFRAFRRSRPVQDLFVRLFKQAGGLVLAGTDTPQRLVAPGASLHAELALLVRAGFQPRDALLAATRDVARLLGADSIGVLVAGAVADFLVLSDNPLEDITNTLTIERVVSRGTYYRPDELRVEW